MDPNRPQITAFRFYATFASILTLAATAAPLEPSTQPEPAPTTDVVTTVPTTAAVPTTLQVIVTQERDEPTTAEVVEAARKGNVYLRAASAISGEGVRETVARTHWWQWLASLGCVIAGVVVGHFSARLIRFVSRKCRDRGATTRAVVFGSFSGPVGLFIAVIGLGIAAFGTIHPPLSVVAGLLPFFQLLHIVVVGWLLYNLIDVVTIVTTRMTRSRQGNLGVMIVPMVRRTLRVVLILILGLFAANNIFNWQIGALLTGLGIVGLAVSLAAQDMLRNLFGSVMIVADQPFWMGDRVKIGADEGVVEDIGFRSTRLRTADGFVITIPNANIAGTSVINYTRRRSIRRTFDIVLAADTPVPKVQDALAAIRQILRDPSLAEEWERNDAGKPIATLDDAAGQRIRISYGFRSASEHEYREHAERLNLLILQRLREIGISYR